MRSHMRIVVSARSRRVVVASEHLFVDGVLRAPADRVVCLVLQQLAPREPERRPFVGETEHAAERRPRLGPSVERRLARAVAQLEIGARRPHRREQVRDTTPEQLAVERRTARRRRSVARTRASVPWRTVHPVASASASHTSRVCESGGWWSVPASRSTRSDFVRAASLSTCPRSRRPPCRCRARARRRCRSRATSDTRAPRFRPGRPTRTPLAARRSRRRCRASTRSGRGRSPRRSAGTGRGARRSRACTRRG